jgi:putative hydroxymethylpyrimidine transport system substrate-binding protein
MLHPALARRAVRFAAAGVLLAAVAAALVAGCSGSSGGERSDLQRDLVLQLDWYPNADHVGIVSALERGLFRRRGLDVSLRPPANVGDPLRLVAAGRADVGISYEPELFYAQQHDLPVVAVAAIVPRALNSIIARGDAGVRRPADLRGTTIGVDGSRSTDAYLDTVLRRSGVSPDDVERVPVGFGLVPALQSGRVDAIIGAFQNVEGVQLRRRGLHPVVFPVDRHGVPPYDELVLVASAARLEDDAPYRRAVRRFVGGMVEGTRWAEAHPRAATSLLSERVARAERPALAASVAATLRLLRPPAGRPYGWMDAAAWSSFGRWMQKSGLLEQAPHGRALVDDALLSRAAP